MSGIYNIEIRAGEWREMERKREREREKIE